MPGLGLPRGRQRPAVEAPAVQHHLQAGAGDAMSFHHVAQPTLGLRKRAPRVADAVVGADVHAAGLSHGGLALPNVDEQLDRAINPEAWRMAKGLTSLHRNACEQRILGRCAKIVATFAHRVQECLKY